MNKYQILALMMRENQQLTEANLFSVTALMAEVLASVSEKLTEDEFYRFVSIGATIYSHATIEFGETVEMEDMFPAEDNSANGAAPGPGDARGRH